MPPLRIGQRVDRRRRLLTEEFCTSDQTGARTPSRRGRGSGGPSQGKSENYGDAAFMEETLRVIDLIPRRLTTFAILLLAGLLIAAGLEALYAWTPQLARYTTDGKVAALDLATEGSLATWFSALSLVAASLAALVVYTVRRHRTDDYRGRYRIWIWAAMCWFLMATDEASSLHEGFNQMMTLLTGTPLVGDGSLWWMIPYFFLLGAVGSRLLLDMRECRLSSAALLGTALCYAFSIVVHMHWILHDDALLSTMFEEGAEMVGDWLLLLTMGLHARYVILDAEGLLPRRRRRPAEGGHDDRRELEEAERSASIATRPGVDQPHGVPQPVFARTASAPATPAVAPAPAPAPTSASAPVGSPVQRKLTKQERRALRQRLLQERVKREQQSRSGWS